VIEDRLNSVHCYFYRRFDSSRAKGIYFAMGTPKHSNEDQLSQETKEGCSDLLDTDQRMSYKEHKSDNELEREPKQSSRKSIGSRKKNNDGIRKRPSNRSGVPITKKRKMPLEAVQNECVSQVNKNAEMSKKAVGTLGDKRDNFRCDKCGSPFIVNPMVRGNKIKRSELDPSPRHKVDPKTKKILSLCNACGLAFNRPKKVKKARVPPSAEEKQKHLDAAMKFADSLVEELNDEAANRLYCTYYTKTLCRCIQKFIGDGKCLESLERARTLLHITSQARKYKSMKTPLKSQDTIQKDNQTEDNSEINNSKKQRKTALRIKSGLGSAQKKSKPFENFVLEQRACLKEKYGLCETGTKRVLLYSNNYLHKRLKTNPEQQCRVVRQKGKIALGKLMPIQDLHTNQCCIDNCVKIALTHQTLLEEWREKSKRGQTEARRVIAEMLTPSGGSRTNCYKFISWVTGKSLTTIGKVNEQMKKTGGNREPPEHGLKSYWKKHPKPKKEKTETKQVAKSTTNVFNHDTTSPVIPAIIQPLGILQAAVNSSGLSAVIQHQQQQQQQQQPIQQQQSQIGQSGSGQIIAMQPSILLPTVQGGTHAIPVNLQQLQLLQLLQQQQQSPQMAIAVNPSTNITRQQLATAPTMVSNGSQPSTFLIAPASPQVLGSVSDTTVTPLLATNLQQSPSPTASHSNLQPQAQYLHVASVAAGSQGPFLLQSGLPGYVSITPQLQTSVLPSSGNFNMAPALNISIASSGNVNVVSTLATTGTLNIPSSGNMNQISANNISLLPQITSTGGDQFIANENTMTLYNAGNISQLLGTQQVQLLAQSTTNSMQRTSTPFETQYIANG